MTSESSSGNQGSKGRSKDFAQKTFTSMVECIKNDMYPSQIARFMTTSTGEKWSKQRVQDRLSRLERDGWIVKTDRSSFVKYALSDQSKGFLTGGEDRA